MVLHECPKCGHSTSDSSNFKKHVKTCDPERPPTNRKKVHKCEACDIVFSFKSGLWKHNKRFHSVEDIVPQRPPALNVGTTLALTNVLRQGVTDFDKTCGEEVIKFISDSPSAQARIKEAFEVGCLHEELTRITHFAGPAQNRNIMGIDMRGTTMKVWCEGKVIRMDATQGVNMIASRNVQLANHSVMREILGVDDEDPVIVDARTTRQRAYETLHIRLVIDNGGTYIMAPISSPSEPKERVPRIAWSSSVRNSVAAQQGWQCNICNDMLTSCFDIDHQVPLFKGGADAYENLQALCVPCHRNKTAVERAKKPTIVS